MTKDMKKEFIQYCNDCLEANRLEKQIDELTEQLEFCAKTMAETEDKDETYGTWLSAAKSCESLKQQRCIVIIELAKLELRLSDFREKQLFED